MTLARELFAMSADAVPRFELLGGRVPVLLIDGFYSRPDEIREAALGLRYQQPPYPYPGSLAQLDEPNASALEMQRTVLDLANQVYLPRVPLAASGKRIPAFGTLFTDFARVDVHPDELSQEQRIPHSDPVPVFGLVYLNRAERGGTLFFQQRAEVPADGIGSGYQTESSPAFDLIGRIEGRFNRLAIYPGFVPHSGDIRGDWIRGQERFSEPRLTQRLIFLP
jgi:hypothetical protein